jgi:hypothetical protein
MDRRQLRAVTSRLAFHPRMHTLAVPLVSKGVSAPSVGDRRLPPLEPCPRPATVIAARIRRTPEHATSWIVSGIADRTPTAGSCGPIAPTMLGPGVLRAIVVDVPEIPRLARNDQTTAPGARDISEGNSRIPQPAQTLVIGRSHPAPGRSSRAAATETAGVSQARLPLD